MGRTARVGDGRRLLVTEPLFLAGAALAVVGTAWFLVNLAQPVGPPVLGWLPAVSVLALTGVAMHRSARSPSVTPAGRRFWFLLAVAIDLAAVSLVMETARNVAGRPIPYSNVAGLTLTIGSIGTALWALYRLPLGTRSRGELVRLGLDSVTVAMSALLFVWYFLIHPTMGRGSAGLEPGAVMFAITGAVCILAIVKVILAGSRTIDPVALRLLGAAALVDIAGSAVQPLLEGHPHLDSVELSAPLTGLFGMAAALQHLRSASRQGHGHHASRTRRQFSVLPYLAVAAVQALLLASLRDPGRDPTLVALAALLLTAIVVARQLMAFRDNARLTDQIAQQERRFRSLVQSASDVIVILDAEGRTIYVSPGAARLTGLPPDVLLGQASWFDADGSEPTVRARWNDLASTPGAKITYESRFRHADGDWRWLEVTQTNLLDDAAVDGVVTNLRDITESHAYQQQLSHQASHDSLTELANRSLFGEQLHQAIARSGPGRLSLALIDLDDFKAVNDTLGHQAGDELLVAVAERLRGSVRPSDLVARLGGDEFAVLLEGITPASVAVAAERILGALTQPVTVEHQELLVQASIGIADLGPDDDASGLLRHADIAMYEAKAAGKGRYSRYTAGMTALASPMARQAAELRHALHAERLELHYQPIVALPGGEVIGSEALIRWRDPERGLVPPGDFIPTAERTGLIVPIGEWVLGEACRQAVRWLADPETEALGSISVNVSARHMRDPAVVSHVTAALRDAGLPADHLTLEITETAVLSHATALDAVRDLRAMGVRVAFDDFGTGHSTLSLLQTCPVDQIKLDRSFLPGAGTAAVATAVVHLARALGIDVVAEGVEDAGQAGAMYTLGYRKAQGFLFGRPAPATAYRTPVTGAELIT
jgi:diguanylate cyclase (GGDEF)-like protein/PAS domain S-box-containing protein